MGHKESDPTSSTAGMAAMELLDRFWFFHNALTGGGANSSTATLRREEEEATAAAATPVQPKHRPPRRPMPTQPSPSSGIGTPPLHQRKKKLHLSEETICHPHKHHHHYHPKERDRDRRQGNGDDGGRRWKSTNDLEHEEVQGFKELGFMFGGGDRLNPILLKMVVPGLHDRDVRTGSKVRRPCPSEAWFARRSAPSVPDLSGRRSAAEMKRQLRFWAKTVASSVRLEC